jgi:hypothetical protein
LVPANFVLPTVNEATAPWLWSYVLLLITNEFGSKNG